MIVTTGRVLLTCAFHCVELPALRRAHTHGFGGPGGGGGYGGSGGSRAQFSALQQHIDELTEEKLQLSRGLQQQVRINEQLGDEVEELTRQYNARGNLVDELERKVGNTVEKRGRGGGCGGRYGIKDGAASS